MNIRATLPDLKMLREKSSSSDYLILAELDDNCYNNSLLENKYGDIVRNLIRDCIERGQLDRRELQDSLRNIFDRTSLSSEECVQVTLGILQERFAEAAQRDVGLGSLALTSESITPSSLALPDVAPELYENRKRPESPIAYYDRVWRAYADAGVLYQDQLRKLDPKLIPAIHTLCSRQQLDPKDHLPPPRQERTKRLAATGDTSAIANLHNAERLRNWRHKREASPL